MAKRKVTIPKRPRDKRRYRRDQEKFVFWKVGSQWYGKSTQIKGARSFKWSRPNFIGGQYKTRSGLWRKIDKQGRSVPTKTPRLAVRKPKNTKRRKSSKNDAMAMGLIREHLTNETPTIWKLEMLPAIVRSAARKSRRQDKDESAPWTQSYRTVARFKSSKPYRCTFFDLAKAMRAIGDDLIVAKAFDGRPSALAFEFGTGVTDDKGVIWHWIAPTLTTSWNSTIGQSESYLVENAEKYEAMGDVLRIRQVQISVE